MEIFEAKPCGRITLLIPDFLIQMKGRLDNCNTQLNKVEKEINTKIMVSTAGV